MDVLEEQIQIALGSWGDAGFTFDGRHYRLEDLDAQPKPVQHPHPPLILGGAGGRRSVRLAAQYGDEYNTPFATLEQAVERRAKVREACEEIGRDPIPFSIMTGVVVGANGRELRDRARRLADKIGADADQLVREPAAGWIVGTVQQAAEQLSELREAGVARVMCQQLLHEDLDAVALLGEALAPQLA
jgi:alkanesulfonate monooxygenase SsuD/methylene tetrahydromethanopterin reductase-like flavin-dependent oxidoreductase (luciferase family)